MTGRVHSTLSTLVGGFGVGNFAFKDNMHLKMMKRGTICIILSTNIDSIIFDIIEEDENIADLSPQYDKYKQISSSIRL